MILYRPVGLEELGLIFDSDFRSFPPRLPEQPIFYPVTNRGYAEQIASEWNTISNSFAGYVTEFSVDDEFVAKYDRKVVGASEHEELWIPAEELEDFNRHLTTRINVISAFLAGTLPVMFRPRSDYGGRRHSTNSRRFRRCSQTPHSILRSRSQPTRRQFT